MTNRLLVFGDVINDIVVVPSAPIRRNTDTPSSISQQPGGSASNVACWLGVLGSPVDFVGRVGSADLESQTRAFATFWVNAQLTADTDLPTGSIVVLVEGDDRTMLTERGANKAFSFDQITDTLLASASIMHFTGYSVFHSGAIESLEQLLARARNAGVRVSVDPASVGDLSDFGVGRFIEITKGASYIFPNLDEGRILTGLSRPLEISAELSKNYGCAVLTMGPDGVVVCSKGSNPIHFAAIPTVGVDPTGAGDAFVAGFLDSINRGTDLEPAVSAGQQTASRAVQKLGARPPLQHNV
ncbi:MAG: carbohydrate kinase family protein [Cryobacterium sp.]|nr:carbohydrate kinase family protein [Cryobacterium sp.]